MTPGRQAHNLNPMVKNEFQTLDTTFAALADPTRRAILDRLGRRPCTVTELAKPYPISLPAVSKHLRVLEKAGLISRRRAGRAQICRLEARPMKRASEWLERHRAFWDAKLDALEEHFRDEGQS